MQSRIWKSITSKSSLIYFILFCLAITGAFVYIYKQALSYPPSNGDDLVILSTISKTPNPLNFLISDWGLHNNAYRPLHSIMIWMVYQRYGVWALPNQFINLGLHIANLLLLFYIVWKENVNKWIAPLLVVAFGASIYAASPTVWVSDRPTLMVATILNLTLIYLLHGKSTRLINSIIILTVLSIAALLCKESGLIIPLTIISYTLLSRSPDRKWILVISLITTLFYLAFRTIIFANQAFSYSESGYLFGITPYSNINQLPLLLKYVGYDDNFVRNLISTILPVFGSQGELLGLTDIKDRAWMILALLLLFAFAVKNRNSNRLGKIAIIILILNSLIHFQLYRYRTLYVGFEALILFIASSFTQFTWKRHYRTIIAALACLTILIWANTSYTRSLIDNQYFKRNQEINKYELTTVIQQRRDQLSPEIIQQVLARYKK
jgi:hypothetical protein